MGRRGQVKKYPVVLPVHMSEADYTTLKMQAAMYGQSMAEVIRSLIRKERQHAS